MKFLSCTLLILLAAISTSAHAEYVKPELTELHRAAFYGKNDQVAFYVQSGVNVNALAGNNNTPLHIAAFKGQTESVRILLTYGANKYLKNADKQTALDIAKAKKFTMIVELLEAAE